MACAEKPMGRQEAQAIKLVQGHTLVQGYFTVVSDVVQKAQDARLSSNAWAHQLRWSPFPDRPS